MAAIQYKVDSSAVVGIQALETKLNGFGAQGWELIVADDSGLLVLKQSSPSVFRYKVDNPTPAMATDPLTFQAYLNALGGQAWDLTIVSTATNTVIFKQSNPAATKQYKVDSSAVLGIQALQIKLDSIGSQSWELIFGDDTGLLVFRKSPLTYRHRVENPTPAAASNAQMFQTYLSALGAQGWDLTVVSVSTNTVIFKQSN